MASTSEELASQADVLQSAIGFFKLNDAPRRTPSPSVKRSVHAKPAHEHHTTDLANMHRAVKSGPSIALDSNTGNEDARDHEFAPYRD